MMVKRKLEELDVSEQRESSSATVHGVILELCPVKSSRILTHSSGGTGPGFMLLSEEQSLGIRLIILTACTHISISGCRR